MNPEHNLDYLAAHYAQQTVQAFSAEPKKAEISLTKTLGVLQENGVYACFLYLKAREDKTGKEIIRNMRALLESMGIKNVPENDLEYARKITADLPTLLLAKEALEQMLIYARYGAKAAGNQ